MKPPVLIDNFGDLLVFDSLDEALTYIEWQDVENGEYVAYDGEGRLLRLEVVKPQGWFAGPPYVALAGEESEPAHASQLRDTLVRFFTRIGVDPGWSATASLGQLVEKALPYKTK